MAQPPTGRRHTTGWEQAVRAVRRATDGRRQRGRRRAGGVSCQRGNRSKCKRRQSAGGRTSKVHLTRTPGTRRKSQGLRRGRPTSRRRLGENGYGTDRKFKALFAAPLASVPPPGSSSAPARCRSPAKAPRGPRRRAAPRGLDKRLRMREGRVARGNVWGRTRERRRIPDFKRGYQTLRGVMYATDTPLLRARRLRDHARRRGLRRPKRMFLGEHRQAR